MPPVAVPRAIQIPRLLKALAALGWESTVVHSDIPLLSRYVPQDQTLVTVSQDSCQMVLASPPLLMGPLRSRFGCRLLERLGWLEPLWRRAAAEVAERLLSWSRFDALVTFAQPWVDHLVGLDLCRKTGIPWVAHFRSWIDSPYLDRTDPRISTWKAQEQAVVREASAVVFVTAQTAERVMEKYPPAWRSKAHVVPHGFDSSLLDLLKEPARTARLRILHTGSLYGIRTPRPFLQALADINATRPLAAELDVLFVGRTDQAYDRMSAEFGLEQVVRFHPHAPYLETLQLAASADILLAIDAPTEANSMFLPSKLVDYLMFRKPILGLTPPRGASANLLLGADCPVVPPDDVPMIQNAVSALLERWKSKKLGVTHQFERTCESHDINLVAQSFEMALDSAIMSGRESAEPSVIRSPGMSPTTVAGSPGKRQE